MYGYNEYVPLTVVEVLKRVSQEDIFKMAIGFTPVEHEYILSPFREDNYPDCYFEWYNRVLYYIDWGSGKKHMDCFNAVQNAFGLGFRDAMLKVNNHFKLGLGTNQPIPPVEKLVLQQSSKHKKPENNKEIVFKTRKFNGGDDRKFWSDRYGITRKQLKEDQVFPVVWYRVFSRKLRQFVVIRPNTRAYAFNEFKDGTKIYVPDNNGRGKFVTNCTQNHIGGLLTLPESGDLLIISKSYKDCRVLRNLGLNSIWLQNEGMIPDDEILIPILKRFNRSVVFFDNDQTGIKSSKFVSDHINDRLPSTSSHIHLPIELLEFDISDPSDLRHRKGEEELSKFLTQNNLL